MCQSLPFGGVKHSGFDRFAGIEGLRGMCIPKVRAAPHRSMLPAWRCNQAAGLCLHASQHAAVVPPFCHVVAPAPSAQGPSALQYRSAVAAAHGSSCRTLVRDFLMPPPTRRQWPRTAGPSRPPSRRCCSTPSATAPLTLCRRWCGCSTPPAGRVSLLENSLEQARPVFPGCLPCRLGPPRVGRRGCGLSCSGWRFWEGTMLHDKGCGPAACSQPAPRRAPSIHCCRQCQGPAQPHCLLPARRREEGGGKGVQRSQG